MQCRRGWLAALLAIASIFSAVAEAAPPYRGRSVQSVIEELRATGLRLERGTSDLTIYVKPAVNVPARAGGRRQVLLKCVDSDGDTVQAQDEAWPFAETDQGAFDPHAHMVLDPLSITAVERCLLEGTEPLLVGRAP